MKITLSWDILNDDCPDLLAYYPHDHGEDWALASRFDTMFIDGIEVRNINHYMDDEFVTCRGVNGEVIDFGFNEEFTAEVVIDA
jgi:hypothetical protein